MLLRVREAEQAALLRVREAELALIRTERDQLQHALDSRVIIEQAKGVVAERNQIAPEEAFEMLRGHARRGNLMLRDVCATVVAGVSEADAVAGSWTRKAASTSQPA